MVQRVLNGMRRLALCLRSRGVPNWPDSTVDSEGRPGFNLLHIQGFNPNSPRIDDKLQECEHVTPEARRTGSIDPPGRAQLNSGIPAARLRTAVGLCRQDAVHKPASAGSKQK